MHQKLNLPFDILTDLHLKTAEQFRLVFVSPVSFCRSAPYVVDKEGNIRAVDVNADYTIRPEPAETGFTGAESVTHRVAIPYR